MDNIKNVVTFGSRDNFVQQAIKFKIKDMMLIDKTNILILSYFQLTFEIPIIHRTKHNL